MAKLTKEEIERAFGAREPEPRPEPEPEPARAASGGDGGDDGDRGGGGYRPEWLEKPEVLADWEARYQQVHGGQKPDETGEGWEDAVVNLQWSEQFAAKHGRAPTDEDWESKWWADKYGGGSYGDPNREFVYWQPPGRELAFPGEREPLAAEPFRGRGEAAGPTVWSGVLSRTGALLGESDLAVLLRSNPQGMSALSQVAVKYGLKSPLQAAAPHYEAQPDTKELSAEEEMAQLRELYEDAKAKLRHPHLLGELATADPEWVAKQKLVKAVDEAGGVENFWAAMKAREAGEKEPPPTEPQKPVPEGYGYGVWNPEELRVGRQYTPGRIWQSVKAAPLLLKPLAALGVFGMGFEFIRTRAGIYPALKKQLDEAGLVHTKEYNDALMLVTGGRAGGSIAPEKLADLRTKSQIELEAYRQGTTYEDVIANAKENAQFWHYSDMLRAAGLRVIESKEPTSPHGMPGEKRAMPIRRYTFADDQGRPLSDEDGAAQVYDFGMEIILDPLNLIPIGALGDVVGLGRKVPGVRRAYEAGDCLKAFLKGGADDVIFKPLNKGAAAILEDVFGRPGAKTQAFKEGLERIGTILKGTASRGVPETVEVITMKGVEARPFMPKLLGGADEAMRYVLEGTDEAAEAAAKIFDPDDLKLLQKGRDAVAAMPVGDQQFIKAAMRGNPEEAAKLLQLHLGATLKKQFGLHEARAPIKAFRFAHRLWKEASLGGRPGWWIRDFISNTTRLVERGVVPILPWSDEAMEAVAKKYPREYTELILQGRFSEHAFRRELGESATRQVQRALFGGTLDAVAPQGSKLRNLLDRIPTPADWVEWGFKVDGKVDEAARLAYFDNRVNSHLSEFMTPIADTFDQWFVQAQGDLLEMARKTWTPEMASQLDEVAEGMSVIQRGARVEVDQLRYAAREEYRALQAGAGTRKGGQIWRQYLDDVSRTWEQAAEDSIALLKRSAGSGDLGVAVGEAAGRSFGGHGFVVGGESAVDEAFELTLREQRARVARAAQGTMEQAQRLPSEQTFDALARARAETNEAARLARGEATELRDKFLRGQLEPEVHRVLKEERLKKVVLPTGGRPELVTKLQALVDAGKGGSSEAYDVLREAIWVRLADHNERAWQEAGQELQRRVARGATELTGVEVGARVFEPGVLDPRSGELLAGWDEAIGTLRGGLRAEQEEIARRMACEAAAEETLNLFFDYTRFSDIEQLIMEVFPFYFYASRDINRTLRLAVENPKLLSKYATLSRNIPDLSVPTPWGTKLDIDLQSLLVPGPAQAGRYEELPEWREREIQEAGAPWLQRGLEYAEQYTGMKPTPLITAPLAAAGVLAKREWEAPIPQVGWFKGFDPQEVEKLSRDYMVAYDVPYQEARKKVEADLIAGRVGGALGFYSAPTARGAYGQATQAYFQEGGEKAPPPPRLQEAWKVGKPQPDDLREVQARARQKALWAQAEGLPEEERFAFTSQHWQELGIKPESGGRMELWQERNGLKAALDVAMALGRPGDPAREQAVLKARNNLQRFDAAHPDLFEAAERNRVEGMSPYELPGYFESQKGQQEQANLRDAYYDLRQQFTDPQTGKVDWDGLEAAQKLFQKIYEFDPRGGRPMNLEEQVYQEYLRRGGYEALPAASFLSPEEAADPLARKAVSGWTLPSYEERMGWQMSPGELRRRRTREMLWSTVEGLPEDQRYDFMARHWKEMGIKPESGQRMDWFREHPFSQVEGQSYKDAYRSWLQGMEAAGLEPTEKMQARLHGLEQVPDYNPEAETYEQYLTKVTDFWQRYEGGQYRWQEGERLLKTLQNAPPLLHKKTWNKEAIQETIDARRAYLMENEAWSETMEESYQFWRGTPDMEAGGWAPFLEYMQSNEVGRKWIEAHPEAWQEWQTKADAAARFLSGDKESWDWLGYYKAIGRERPQWSRYFGGGRRRGGRRTGRTWLGWDKFFGMLQRRDYWGVNKWLEKNIDTLKQRGQWYGFRIPWWELKRLEGEQERQAWFARWQYFIDLDIATTEKQVLTPPSEDRRLTEATGRLAKASAPESPPQWVTDKYAQG